MSCESQGSFYVIFSFKTHPYLCHFRCQLFSPCLVNTRAGGCMLHFNFSLQHLIALSCFSINRHGKVEIVPSFHSVFLFCCSDLAPSKLCHQSSSSSTNLQNVLKSIISCSPLSMFGFSDQNPAVRDS